MKEDYRALVRESCSPVDQDQEVDLVLETEVLEQERRRFQTCRIVV